jgi:citrate synthase
MGHRVYRVRDPRAAHLEATARVLGEATDLKWYHIARAVEDAAAEALRDMKPDRRLYANVEFYTAPTLYALGIPPDEFTCMFACARMAGWSAHILEQLADNRLIRPQASYTGPPRRAWEPVGSRHSAGPA